MVPSEVSSTAFEGIASTIIVSESPSTSEITKSKEPAVSSEKVKELSSKVGSSLTGVTVKEMVAVLELDPSVAVRTSVPYELVSELVFSSEKKKYWIVGKPLVLFLHLTRYRLQWLKLNRKVLNLL